MRTYTLTIEVDVDDENALMTAARAQAVKDGGTENQVNDVADAIVWLLDPGVSPPGLLIVQSSCEAL